MDVENRAAASFGAAVMRIVSAASTEPASWFEVDGAAMPLVREAGSAVPATGAILCGLDARGHIWVVSASEVLEEELADVRGRLDETQFAHAVTGGRVTTLTPDPDVDGLLAPHLVRVGVRRMRVQPLMSPQNHRPLGVLIIVRFDDRDFTAEDGNVLDAWAGLIMMRLVQAAGLQQDRRRGRRFELGVELAVEMAAAASPGEVMDRLLARVLQIVSVERATMLRLDGEQVVAEAVQDVDGRGLESAYHYRVVDQPGVRLALERRRPVFDEELSSDAMPRAVHDILQDVKHFAVIPLMSGDDVIGFLNVMRRHEGEFDDDDVETLDLIGRLAAVALKNARLIEDTAAARTAMSEFLRVIMHELRGPLTIIGGYLSMIQEGIFGDVPEAWSRPLDTMDGKVREAQRLVDELLLASRLEDGNFPVHVETVDMADAVRRAVARAQPRAVLLHATLDAQVDHAVPACADANHLDRILDNLINNGLTHGVQPPAVRVAVNGNGDVAVTVTDNGRGVDADERERVFERFYRGRGSGGGMGLGLYISRLLAEQCGGSLELASPAEGEGASFVLHLPAAAPVGAQ